MVWAALNMLRSLVVVAAVFVIASTALGQTRYSTYTNDRFFFSVDYPSSLFEMQPPPENNDGRTFLSKDRHVEMRVWGVYDALSETLEQKYNAALKSFTKRPTYTVFSKSRFVVSGVRDNRIVYIKTLYRRTKDTDIFYTLTIEYPLADKIKYDTVVTHIANSFKIIQGADI
jgi:hypothetical protein